MRLHRTLELRTAEAYSAPQNPADRLPVVYGDFRSPGTNAPNEDSGGCTPCVCINRHEGVLLASDSRCLTPVTEHDLPQLYLNDTLQEPSVYGYYPAVDYEAHGRLIAVFQLAPSIRANVTAGQWSCRIKGTVDGAGQLITSPILALKDFFINHGDWLSTDFDSGTTAQAVSDCEQRAFFMHWCFLENLTYKAHLAQVLQHCLANHGIDANGRLRIMIDADPIWPEKVWTLLDARYDLAGEDPESSVELVMDKDDLCNRALVDYRYKWHTGDYTTTAARLESRQSQQSYGVRDRTFQLPGLRTEDHGRSWTEQILRRSALLPTKVRLRVPQLRLAYLFPGMYFGLTYRYGPDVHGRGWTNRILLVRNLSADVMAQDQAVGLECEDTGVSYRPSTYIEMTDQHGRVWYISIDESGTLSADEAIPGIEQMNAGTVWQWLSRVNPLGVTYYIRPTANEDGTGFQFRIEDAVPSGIGSSLASLTFVNRYYEGWHIAVGERPQIITRRIN